MPPQYPAMMLKPAAATVFGILDIVIASIGLLMGIAAVFQATSRPLFPGPASRIYDHPAPLLCSAAVRAAVALPMIVAGIALLKGRRNAIKWSNRYTLCSIISKFINTAITIVYIGPKMQEIMESLPSSPIRLSFLYSPAYYCISGLVGMTYPVLCYVLLNRPQVKNWFAAQPV